MPTADVLVKNVDTEAYKLAKVLAAKENRRVGDIVSEGIIVLARQKGGNGGVGSMIHRIEIASTVADTRAEVRKKKFESLGFAGRVNEVSIVDVYTIDAALASDQLEKIALMLANPVTSKAETSGRWRPKSFDWEIEIGYLPGVTDNVATTAKEEVEDLLKAKLGQSEGVYSSQITFITGECTAEEARSLGESLANPLIQRITIKSAADFARDGGMGIVVPKVTIRESTAADTVEILNATDEELARIGKEGIANKDGTRRGPLALDISYMKAIQAYFKKKGRNPTDIELESLAQTWSEHCKHTIFRDPLDEVKDGVFKTFIRAATQEVRKRKGKNDFCVSVFTDNSGAIAFDDDYLITDKVETHNSPSALDPFGGAETGIVGVNRDTVGFGMGAKPVINKYAFCFADPKDEVPLYRGPNKTQKMLLPRQIIDGVVAGVNAGGNCSGIPTPQGALFFDQRYKGKPLVFCGTVGLIPRKVNGKPSHIAGAKPGDLIVMLGGRVGQDGIHGATFSSEALNTGSPATAVQIGDPITQKKFSDAIVKEARDQGLYSSITDDGAGGLSSSVGEMATQSGGCNVQLHEVPLKYPNLSPWQIWISESQERMTLAVPKEKWDAFRELMARRGAEATAIGEFTDSGKCVVEYKGRTIVDIDLEFLHDGLPKRPMKSQYSKTIHEEPKFAQPKDLSGALREMLSRLNIAGYEFIPSQYDHEVQGGSALKPLQGRGRVCGDASVTRPRLDSQAGVVLSYGANPAYSEVNTYAMAAYSIDTAIRNAVCAGANPEHLALLDNFCWCSSNEPQRLGELKAAARACYDYAVAYGAPFISGKDSMFNDFKGYDENGKPVKVSVPPTLLISAISVMKDSQKAVSLDAKFAGDFVYVIGETLDEMGASEYYALVGERERQKPYIGNKLAEVDGQKNAKAYAALAKCIDAGLVASAQSVHRGGLAVALAKTAMAGMLGIEASLKALPGKQSREDYALFSESAGRAVVTVSPTNAAKFEQAMKGIAFAKIGEVTTRPVLSIFGKDGSKIAAVPVAEMLASYKSTFAGY